MQSVVPVNSSVDQCDLLLQWYCCYSVYSMQCCFLQENAAVRVPLGVPAVPQLRAKQAQRAAAQLRAEGSSQAPRTCEIKNGEDATCDCASRGKESDPKRGNLGIVPKNQQVLQPTLQIKRCEEKTALGVSVTQFVSRLFGSWACKYRSMCLRNTP